MASQTWSVQLVTTLDDLLALAEEWRSLWRRCQGNRTPFLDFDWVRLWCEHYELDDLMRILVVRKGARVSGIVPLVVHRYAVGPVGLTALETLAGQSRNLVGLVEPGAEEGVARTLASSIDEHFLGRGNSMRLSLVPSSSVFIDALLGAFSSCGRGGSIRVRTSSRAPYVPLPISWDDYWQSMSSKRRKVLRRAIRNLERRHAVLYSECVDEDEIRRGLDALYACHQMRWQRAGMNGLFADERTRRFHTAVVLAHARSRLLRVPIMLVDGEPASVHLVGVLDGVAYLIRSGRDESLARYSIGHLHEMEVFQRAIREGLGEADFLRGIEPYKFYWTSRYRQYLEVVIVGRVAHGLIPIWFAQGWFRIAQFFENRHSIRELASILRIRSREARERDRMGIDV